MQPIKYHQVSLNLIASSLAFCCIFRTSPDESNFRQFLAILGHFRPFLRQIFRQFFFAQIANPATELAFLMYAQMFSKWCCTRLHWPPSCTGAQRTLKCSPNGVVQDCIGHQTVQVHRGAPNVR